MKKYTITCAPEVALNILIDQERTALIQTASGHCVWCGEDAEDSHYLAPVQDIADKDSAVFYRACCQEHADEYRANYVALIEAALPNATVEQLKAARLI